MESGIEDIVLKNRSRVKDDPKKKSRNMESNIHHHVVRFVDKELFSLLPHDTDKVIHFCRGLSSKEKKTFYHLTRSSIFAEYNYRDLANVLVILFAETCEKTEAKAIFQMMEDKQAGEFAVMSKNLNFILDRTSSITSSNTRLVHEHVNTFSEFKRWETYKELMYREAEGFSPLFFFPDIELRQYWRKSESCRHVASQYYHMKVEDMVHQRIKLTYDRYEIIMKFLHRYDSSPDEFRALRRLLAPIFEANYPKHPNAPEEMKFALI